MMPNTTTTATPIVSGRHRAALKPLLAGLLLLLGAASAHASDSPAPLRFCMDPDNPPFSSSKGDAPGLYVELGRHIAAALGRDFAPVWTLSYFGKRSVRTTLLEHECDAYIGLPETTDFMGPRVAISQPVVQLGWVMVTAKSRPVASLTDLKGMRVAVQFASPPQSLLAEHDDIISVTVLEPAEAMKALASGTVDAAFIWGPSAGYINKTSLGSAYKVQPVEGRDMQWEAAIGFAKEQSALRDEVNGVIASSADTIAALKEKYGFPSLADAPIKLATTELSTPAAAASADAAAEIAEGHHEFNENCSHCHGPDAVQAERRIDLRRLHVRYGDDMDNVFQQTTHNGRPDKGMPNWSGVLSDETLNKILMFLHSIQS